ncbi:MAG: glycosyltransferase family 39 protein [Bacteroidetes bacterium]|nr:glycosyltransferase family 39 protein [Bacteroidota bacterium]
MQETPPSHNTPSRFALKPAAAHLLFALCCVIFVVAKLPYLQLPYYWDEAWVYAPAIHEMTAAGPSLAPDAIPAELTRGHPLLFHFFGSLWAGIFGLSELSLHSYALSISLLLLWSVYRILSRWFNLTAGLLGVLLLCVQPLFFAQSALVLPEVMLSMWLLLALDAYARQKWWQYALFAAAAVLTKETAVALFAALSLHRFLCLLKQRNELKKHLQILLKINSPALVFIAFLLWQKAVRGWMFFPYHLELMHLKFFFIKHQFLQYTNFIFIYQGRNIFVAVLAIAAALGYSGKFSLQPASKKLLAAFGLFALVFLLLSIINFYSGRYVLVLIVLLVITVAAFISSFSIPRWVLWLCFLVLPVPSLVNLITYAGKDDSERGYADAVLVMQQASHWLTLPEHRTPVLYAPFLIKNALTDPRQGYVDAASVRANVTSDRTTADYIALSSFETGDEMELLLKDTANFRVLETFEKNNVKLIIAAPVKK